MDPRTSAMQVRQPRLVARFMVMKFSLLQILVKIHAPCISIRPLGLRLQRRKAQGSAQLGRRCREFQLELLYPDHVAE